MKKFVFEVKENEEDCFDNWIGDYIEAETKEEALEIGKQWLIDNGYAGDVNKDLIYNIFEKIY